MIWLPPRSVFFFGDPALLGNAQFHSARTQNPSLKADSCYKKYAFSGAMKLLKAGGQRTVIPH